MTLKPIVWEAGRYGTHYAKLGRFTVAQISWSTTRDDSTPYHAEVTLFGRQWRGKYATLDDAKAHAERIVAKLVGELVEESA